MLRSLSIALVLLLPTACTLGLDHSSPCSRQGCDRPSYCDDDPYRGGSYLPPGSYTAPPVDDRQTCVANEQCPARSTCSYGRCQPAPTRCADDFDCAPGASCNDGVCGCRTDADCGDGLTCQRDSAYGGYGYANRCVVCLSGSTTCTAPTCSPSGECPGNLVCNEATVTCAIPPERIPCSDECPRGMVCGVDSFCVQSPFTSADAGGEASDASSGDADASID